MSQLFRRYKMRDVGTSAQDAPDGTDFDTFDTIVGIHCANRAATAINVDVFITTYNDDDPSNNPNDTYYLVKGAPIASGGALQILDGGAKIVVQDGDRLWVQSDTLNSVDAWISTVKAISN